MLGLHFVLIVTAATLHPFDHLNGIRFWVQTWPLAALLFVALLSRARRRHAWLRFAGLGALVLTIALYAVADARFLKRAHRPQGLMRAEWRRAANMIPGPHVCRVMISDARPVLVHRETSPILYLPASREEFEYAARRHQRLCMVILTRDLPGGARHKQRGKPSIKPAAFQLYQRLLREKRLSLVKDHPSMHIYEVVKPRRSRPSRENRR